MAKYQSFKEDSLDIISNWIKNEKKTTEKNNKGQNQKNIIMFEEENNEKKPFKRFEMVRVDLKCGECGAEIKELPFQPDGNRPVYCRTCHQKRKNAGGFRV